MSYDPYSLLCYDPAEVVIQASNDPHTLDQLNTFAKQLTRYIDLATQQQRQRHQQQQQEQQSATFPPEIPAYNRNKDIHARENSFCHHPVAIKQEEDEDYHSPQRQHCYVQNGLNKPAQGLNDNRNELLNDNRNQLAIKQESNEPVSGNNRLVEATTEVDPAASLATENHRGGCSHEELLQQQDNKTEVVSLATLPAPGTPGIAVTATVQTLSGDSSDGGGNLEEPLQRDSEPPVKRARRMSTNENIIATISPTTVEGNNNKEKDGIENSPKKKQMAIAAVAPTAIMMNEQFLDRQLEFSSYQGDTRTKEERRAEVNQALQYVQQRSNKPPTMAKGSHNFSALQGLLSNLLKDWPDKPTVGRSHRESTDHDSRSCINAIKSFFSNMSKVFEDLLPPHGKIFNLLMLLQSKEEKGSSLQKQQHLSFLDIIFPEVLLLIGFFESTMNPFMEKLCKGKGRMLELEQEHSDQYSKFIQKLSPTIKMLIDGVDDVWCGGFLDGSTRMMYNHILKKLSGMHSTLLVVAIFLDGLDNKDCTSIFDDEISLEACLETMSIFLETWSGAKPVPPPAGLGKIYSGAAKPFTIFEVERGGVYFHCPKDSCYVAKQVPEPFASKLIKASHDGNAWPVDQSICQSINKLRQQGFFKSMRKHIINCTGARESQDNKVYENYLPPLFRQVKIKYDQDLVKDADGKRQYKYYRSANAKRKKDLHIEANKEKYTRFIALRSTFEHDPTFHEYLGLCNEFGTGSGRGG